MVTICTASLTFNNSTFCPHTVFMCLVWISEETAIISLYNINWLVFITKTQCVHCAVRTEFWSKCQVNRVLKPTVSHIRRLVGVLSPRRHGFDPSSLHMRFVVNKFSLGHFFLSGRRVFHVSIVALLLYLHLHSALTGRTNERNQKTSQEDYLWAMQLGICVSRLSVDHCQSRSMIWDLSVRNNSISGCWSKAVFLAAGLGPCTGPWHQLYRSLAPIILGPGTNYTGPWRQLYRALAPIMPYPGTNYTGPWRQLYRSLAPIIPGPGTNYTGPWHQLYRSVAPVIPGPGTNYAVPWHQLYRALASIIPDRNRLSWNLSF